MYRDEAYLAAEDLVGIEVDVVGQPHVGGEIGLKRAETLEDSRARVGGDMVARRDFLSTLCLSGVSRTRRAVR